MEYCANQFSWQCGIECYEFWSLLCLTAAYSLGKGETESLTGGESIDRRKFVMFFIGLSATATCLDETALAAEFADSNFYSKNIFSIYIWIDLNDAFVKIF